MNKKHGMSKTPTYGSWKSMKERCDKINHKSHKYYKNISYCAAWAEFSEFFKDMGQRPNNTTLDRVNNEDGYYKENCRWASHSQQSINKRSSSNTGIKNISKVDFKTNGYRYTLFNVQIKRNNKKVFNKFFKTIDLAMAAKNQALKEIGEER